MQACLYSDEHVSTALGYVAHFTQLAANYANIPLRYPIKFACSRSYMTNPFEKTPNGGPMPCPLYVKGAQKARFPDAVDLLNKDLEQVRSSYDELYALIKINPASQCLWEKCSNASFTTLKFACLSFHGLDGVCRPLLNYRDRGR